MDKKNYDVIDCFSTAQSATNCVGGLSPVGCCQHTSLDTGKTGICPYQNVFLRTHKYFSFGNMLKRVDKA